MFKPVQALEDTMKNYLVGLDIGSTTVKIAVLDNKGNLIHKQYGFSTLVW